MRHTLIRTALSTIALAGADRWLATRCRGRGVILTFHHVAPEPEAVMPENAGLSITPGFLDRLLHLLDALGYAIVPLAEVPSRLAERGPPVAALTFDDGYRDNTRHALPVLEAHRAPFTMFVCTGFADRTAPLWWLDLEEALGRQPSIRLAFPDGVIEGPTGTPAERLALWRKIYWRLRRHDESVLEQTMRVLVDTAGLDPLGRVERLCLGWQELRYLARHPLASIGAHTTSHPRLARIPADHARIEIEESRRRIREELDVDPRVFAYPVGDAGSAGPREFGMAREAGYALAVTTQANVLKAGQSLHALPRISVNGHYQKDRYLRTLISGVPFALKG
jgi:peptidoglycan/xylan/chitin deacetylase (PgdA/CDA1 family)